MLLDTENGAISIVVELHVFRAPKNEHRRPLFQEDAESCLEALGPGFQGTDGSLAPIDGSHQLAHLSTAIKELCCRLANGFGGRGESVQCAPRVHRFTSSASGSSQLIVTLPSAGISNRNVDPCPGSDSTQMRPW